MVTILRLLVLFWSMMFPKKENNEGMPHLGIISDKFININDQANSVLRSQDALITVVHAFVTSRIGYRNSLLYGIADCNMNRLQHVQMNAARVMNNNGKHSHAKIILQNVPISRVK